MREFLWRLFARFVSQPRVAEWFIERSKRTPYVPITSRDGSEIYMHRGWIFNPYSKDENDNVGPPRWSWLPSVRVHHILRADDDDHLHDHPWNARTIVLRGWYREERPASGDHWVDLDLQGQHYDEWTREYQREPGYTGRVLFGQYHRISKVAQGGVYTLWFTWRYQGTWGFLVDGKKVPYREYLAGRPRT